MDEVIDKKKKQRQKKNKKKNLKLTISLLSVFTSVINFDERCQSIDRLHYDTYSSEMVCENIANFHICNRRNMFVVETRKVSNQQVYTIVGKGHQPSGIGTAKWIWCDNSGKSHECLIEDALFFPQSPINILRVTYFARHLNDLTCTGTNTQKLHSYFYCDSNKFSLTIQHPPSNLPDISINEGFALSTIFCVLLSRVVNVPNHLIYGCCFTNMDANEDN